MASRKLKQYAIDILAELRADNKLIADSSLPALDLGDVEAITPDIKIAPHHVDITYDEDDMIFQIDPTVLKVGDSVVLGRDPSNQVVVLGVADYENEDPFENLEAAALRDNFKTLESEARTWRGPVQTVSDLPAGGNREGDVRLVIDTCELYKWSGVEREWQLISGGGSGNFLPLTGGTLSGDLIMDPGTMITLPDPPVDPSDVVNKAYVDFLFSLIGGAPLIPTISVNTNYSALPTDHTILVDATGGPVTITLPASHVDCQEYDIKDKFGVAAITPITIISADGDTIDLLPSFTLTTNYQSLTVVSDGTNWFSV